MVLAAVQFKAVVLLAVVVSYFMVAPIVLMVFGVCSLLYCAVLSGVSVFSNHLDEEQRASC